MRSQKVNFTNSKGHQLSGKLDMPVTGSPKAYVLFAHCFTCSKNLKSVDRISTALTQQDLAVLRFDFTGLGQSEGDFSDTNFTSNIEDLRRAYAFLEEEFEAPQILVGHSLGGMACLYAAGKMKNIRAVATIGSPADPAHVMKLFPDPAEIRKKGFAKVNIGGQNFMIEKQLLSDLESRDSGQVITDLDKALLILHSPQDKIVDIENAATIYEAAMHPKSFVTLDGADHLLSKAGDALYTGSLIATWASRYLEVTGYEEVAPEGEVWTRLSDQGFLTEIVAGAHHMIADEPEESGGTNLGPSPYGYLLAALGTCTAMTLRMYADHKGLELDEVKVKLTHEKIHAKDSGGSDEAPAKIDRISRKVYLEGKLSAQERKRLVEIANRCPVHRTLEGKPEILTEETDRF